MNYDDVHAIGSSDGILINFLFASYKQEVIEELPPNKSIILIYFDEEDRIAISF